MVVLGLRATNMVLSHLMNNRHCRYHRPYLSYFGNMYVPASPVADLDGKLTPMVCSDSTRSHPANEALEGKTQTIEDLRKQHFGSPKMI